MNDQLREFLTYSLETEKSKRPSARQLLQHSFLVNHFHTTEDQILSLPQPHLVHNIPDTIFTMSQIKVYIGRVVMNVFKHHRFEQDLKVENIWDEPNRMHLALSLGLTLSELVRNKHSLGSRE